MLRGMFDGAIRLRIMLRRDKEGENMSETSSSNHTAKDVFHMKEGDNGKTFWTKIGSAFVNRDGSINAYLDALPRDGKIQIRDRRSKEEKYSKRERE